MHHDDLYYAGPDAAEEKMKELFDPYLWLPASALKDKGLVGNENRQYRNEPGDNRTAVTADSDDMVT